MTDHMTSDDYDGLKDGRDCYEEANRAIRYSMINSGQLPPKSDAEARDAREYWAEIRGERLHQRLPRRTALDAEYADYLLALRHEDISELLTAGVKAEDIYHNHMVGVARITVGGDRWYPDEGGKRAFITPVRQDGVTVDLVAWHPIPRPCISD